MSTLPESQRPIELPANTKEAAWEILTQSGDEHRTSDSNWRWEKKEGREELKLDLGWQTQVNGVYHKNTDLAEAIKQIVVSSGIGYTPKNLLDKTAPYAIAATSSDFKVSLSPEFIEKSFGFGSRPR